MVSEFIRSKFAPLSESALQMIVDIAQERHVKKGDVYLENGTVCKNISYVYKGLMREFYYKDGRDITEFFAFEGRGFSSLESMFRHQPSLLSVEALEDSHLVVVPYVKLRELCRHNLEISDFYNQMLEESLVISQQRFFSLQFESARERYRSLLSTYPDLVKRVSSAHIASYLGITRETFSRIKAELR